jgi:hypothetical protein
MAARRAMILSGAVLALGLSAGAARVSFAATHGSQVSTRSRAGFAPTRVLVAGSEVRAARPRGLSYATSAGAADVIPVYVSQIVQSVASEMGDPTPTSVTGVLTTRGAAAALQGAVHVDSASNQVWYVTMTGNFVDKHAFGAPGGAYPSGTEVDFMIDTQTQHVLDFGISNSPPDLSSLGTVHPIVSNN